MWVFLMILFMSYFITGTIGNLLFIYKVLKGDFK